MSQKKAVNCNFNCKRTHYSIKCSKMSAMIEFPFLCAWNMENTSNQLNKPNFTNFKGRNLGLTKKELM